MQRKFGENSIWVYEILRYVIYACFRTHNGMAECQFVARGVDRSEGEQVIMRISLQDSVDVCAWQSKRSLP